MKDDLPAGYEQAIALKMYEGQLVWSRFQSMLVVNTILLGSMGIFLSSKTPNELVIDALSVFGLLLCIVWLITSIRGFAFNDFWSFTIRELEESSKKVKLLTKGELFKNDLPVEFGYKNRKTDLNIRHQRPLIGRLFNTKVGVYIIIALFIVLYLVILILSITHNISIIGVR